MTARKPADPLSDRWCGAQPRPIGSLPNSQVFRHFKAEYIKAETLSNGKILANLNNSVGRPFLTAVFHPQTMVSIPAASKE